MNRGNLIRRGGLYFLISSGMIVGPLGSVGCEELPGTDEQQGAVIGGVGGAIAGAAIGGDNRLLGALIGGALGAGGGYLIGANKDKILNKDREDAEEASERAARRPATADDVDEADTGDLNDDGFVTMDEVVAMQDAGLSDREILRRLEDTGQVFELTADQQDFLRDNGVSSRVVNGMEELNQDERREVLTRDDVLGSAD